MALSGVDLACWDLLARAERKPVFELLGGVATAIPAYATSNNLDLVQQYGYIAMKLTHRWRTPADEDAVESKLAEARAALGPAARLMVDCYMSWDAAVARRLAARLRDYHVYWFEDVLTPDALTELAELRPQVKPIALAAGEHEMTEQGFALAAAAGAFDIWQPDVTWCGGISGALRILAVAAAARTPVVLHRGGEPWGLHLILATGCEKLAETMPERWQPDGEQLWLDEPQVVAGCIAPTDAPGFGVRLNQALL
jgi:L-alanine-DL-glutamate epimerase-like enolase superfamily enzyme